MMKHAVCMNAVDPRPACAETQTANYVFMSAACFDVLRFRFYYYYNESKPV